MIVILLLLAALILFVLEAMHVTSRINLGWLGLACVAASLLVPMIG